MYLVGSNYNILYVTLCSNVLCVCVLPQPPEYSIDENVYFASMEELCEHYQMANLPGCDFKLCSTY